MKWLRGLIGNDRLVLALLALAVGGAVGGAVIVFREAIVLVQTVFYGSGTEYLYTHAAGLAWWRLLLAPTLGGLLVGVLVHRLMAERRNRGPADVIEASALRAGRMAPGEGLLAAALSALSIGVGASVGREGPAVHFGATIGGWLGGRCGFPRPPRGPCWGAASRPPWRPRSTPPSPAPCSPPRW